MKVGQWIYYAFKKMVDAESLFKIWLREFCVFESIGCEWQCIVLYNYFDIVLISGCFNISTKIRKIYKILRT